MDDFVKKMREKAREGSLSMDDMRDIVSYFSKGRESAMFASRKSKELKKGKKSINNDRLKDIDPFEGLS